MRGKEKRGEGMIGEGREQGREGSEVKKHINSM